MRDIIKALFPSPLLRHVRAARVNRCVRLISKTANRSACVLIEPDNRVEHYYHSILDLALPLWCLSRAASPETEFILRPFGVFTDRIPLLFPNVRIAGTGEDISAVRRRLLGMNPLFVHVTHDQMTAFRSYVLDRLDVPEPESAANVLLIERLPPQEYFVTEAVKKGGGTSRRSIRNHAELRDAVEKAVKPPFQFQNVQLEVLSFSEQVRLFANAALVIGQHGAGLANCIWMQPHSSVIELGNDESLRHFQIISRAMRHRYLLHRTQERHATIDIDGLLRQARGEEHLRAIL